MKKEISISFIEITEDENLTAAQKLLIESAQKAMVNAYAPYSNFQVGAAVRLANGQVVSGSNMENASYPLCICAEHVAISRAHASFPDQAIEAIAITASGDKHLSENPVPPCGACRQIIIESEHRFQNNMEVILRAPGGKTWMFYSGKSLLPFSFDGNFLK
jgi:cytidine deaminase